MLRNNVDDENFVFTVFDLYRLIPNNSNTNFKLKPNKNTSSSTKYS